MKKLKRIYQVVTQISPEDVVMVLDMKGNIVRDMPVFTLGEILICDENGRELDGIQRKAGKWYVEVEEFDNIDKAIKKAREVLGYECYDK